jgi:hypothetical protein
MMPLLTPLHDNSPPSRPELDFRAAVHDDFESRRLCGRRRFVVADPQLHPHDLGANRDRVGDDAGRFLGRAENVDHVDLVRNVAQRRICGLAEQALSCESRVDRDHAIAFALQVLHHEIAGPVPVRRGADHRNRLHPLDDRVDFRVRIGDRFEIGHARSLLGKRATF